MRLVERHLIDKNHRDWAEIDDLSFKAKNLYNLVNYYCRKRFFVAKGVGTQLPLLPEQRVGG